MPLTSPYHDVYRMFLAVVYSITRACMLLHAATLATPTAEAVAGGVSKGQWVRWRGWRQCQTCAADRIGGYGTAGKVAQAKTKQIRTDTSKT